jgi:hypothetical protein
MLHCKASDHFRIKQGMARQRAMEDAAMAVSPIHHGGHGEQFPAHHIKWLVLVHAAAVARGGEKLNREIRAGHK